MYLVMLLLYYFFITLVPKKIGSISTPSPPPNCFDPLLLVEEISNPSDYSKPPDYSVLESTEKLPFRC